MQYNNVLFIKEVYFVSYKSMDQTYLKNFRC